MVYLDYAATAVPRYRVSDFNDNWFNPNSQYAVDECLGFDQCEKAVKEAIGAKSGKVIFGGNASWFFEKLYTNQANFWLCSPYEHDCIYKNGIEIKKLSSTIFANKIYCHQFVNNITGEIFPVNEIGKFVKDKGGFFICDVTAGLGKAVIPDNIEEWCDCLVCSSHKLGVDNKQIGFAWVSDKFESWLGLDDSIINGYGWVDGTPDLACAKATTEAVFKACKNINKYNQHYNTLASYLANSLENSGVKYSYITHVGQITNAIKAIILYGINANILCNYLASEHKVYIGVGHSACEENSDYRILKQYGLTQEECESTIRVSFCPCTSEEDIDGLIKGIIDFKEKFGG